MRWLLLAVGLACAAPFGAHPALAADKAKAKPAAAAPGASDEKIAEDLKAFCRKWMGFLETRERDNTRGIKWQAKGTGMAGQYVGYSKEYDCIMKERSSNGTPVATIVYKEFVYEKAGATKPEAEQAQPTIVDATEVTEIFRYTKGAWVY
ncbi:MAG: hypothetical protein SF182_29870 [Deltaproteobacteria bacterium]|nr:hypothetical protein [Deltaproteobacteria bacterium]